MHMCLHSLHCLQGIARPLLKAVAAVVRAARNRAGPNGHLVKEGTLNKAACPTPHKALKATRARLCSVCTFARHSSLRIHSRGAGFGLQPQCRSQAMGCVAAARVRGTRDASGTVAHKLYMQPEHTTPAVHFATIATRTGCKPQALWFAHRRWPRQSPTHTLARLKAQICALL